MDRKQRGYLLLGFGSAWIVSRLFALIRGDPMAPTMIGLAIGTVLLTVGLILAKEIEFNFSFFKKDGKKEYEGYLANFD